MGGGGGGGAGGLMGPTPVPKNLFESSAPRGAILIHNMTVCS